MHRLVLAFTALAFALSITAGPAQAQRAMAHPLPHAVATKPAPHQKPAPK
jgi:hypothetical protein